MKSDFCLKAMDNEKMRFTEAEIFRATEKAHRRVLPGTMDSVEALTIELNLLLKKKLEQFPTAYGILTPVTLGKGIAIIGLRPREGDTHKFCMVNLEKVE